MGLSVVVGYVGGLVLLVGPLAWLFARSWIVCMLLGAV